MSSARAGGFFTIESPGKPWELISLPCLMGLSRRHETHGSETECSFLIIAKAVVRVSLFLHWSPKPNSLRATWRGPVSDVIGEWSGNIITIYSSGRHCIIQSWKQTFPLLQRYHLFSKCGLKGSSGYLQHIWKHGRLIENCQPKV